MVLSRPQCWGIEVHLDSNLYLGDQQLVEVKHFYVGYHEEGTCHSCSRAGDLGSKFGNQRLVVRGQGFEIVVSESQLIGHESVGPIDAIDPSFRFQNGLSIVSVVIQQGLQVDFEVVGVGLGTDGSVVEANADLFEEGVGYVIDQKCVFGSHCIHRTRFLQFPFNLEVTAQEIHVFILRIDLKIDRVDPRGEGMNGDHAVTHHAEIGRGNLEQIQDGIVHPR